ncbi:MAG TPA: cupin domain-containing protein [Cyclobacteriaceae bacterium]|nr:cupin domain-containing protein [Cyclobacteriaceae bacterium]
MMNRFLFSLLLLIPVAASAQSLSKRIVHNDPAKYRTLSSVHAGAGQMGFTQLIGRTELSTNFLYLHAGVIQPKSGIGHHFHHTIEEMYVLLDGEAEFTVNGRTSLLKAPVVVPCKMGDSHAIYNTGNEPVRWLNFAVSRNKGVGDAFDLGDDRVGAALDPKPVFVFGQLQRDKLKADKHPYVGDGALYRQLVGPEVFTTNWDHVDHVVIPAGKSAGPRQLEGVEEVYFVVKGSGKLTIGSASSDIKADDTFFGLLGETVSLANEGKDDLELLVIGISNSPNKDPNRLNALSKPKAMILQMDFVVPKENCEAFEKMYHSIYVPAMTVQEGYLGSSLLRLFPADLSKQIEAEPTDYNYSIQISFDTEENRKKWVASEQHKIAWPAASKLAKSYKWRGYDVMGDDHQ